MTKTLDEQIQIFINNNLTLRKIKNEENYPYKQIQELRYNLNSLFINKYLDNQYELDPKNISCSYDKFAETWTLTTDIPAL